MSRKQERQRWYNMLQRCENPRNPSYRYYGARGIHVCERWHDFETYYADVMQLLGPLPDPRMSLDRIDNDGNYEPGNVRWATLWQQVKNSRNYGRRWSTSDRMCPSCRYIFVDIARHMARRHPGYAEED